MDDWLENDDSNLKQSLWKKYIKRRRRKNTNWKLCFFASNRNRRRCYFCFRIPGKSGWHARGHLSSLSLDKSLYSFEGPGQDGFRWKQIFGRIIANPVAYRKNNPDKINWSKQFLWLKPFSRKDKGYLIWKSLASLRGKSQPSIFYKSSTNQIKTQWNKLTVLYFCELTAAEINLYTYEKF